MKATVATILFFVLAVSLNMPAAQARKALSKPEVEKLLQSDAGADRTIAILKEQGIDFVPSEEYLAELRAKGTKQEVLDALRAAAPKGMSKEDILALLKNGTGQKAIMAMVERQGIAFRPTDDDFDDFRAAGASDALYEALQKARQELPPPEDELGKDITPPVPVYQPKPSYTREAAEAKFSGLVVLTVTIDATGNVMDAQVTKPVGYGLDEAAVKAVKTWRFKPATRSGVPVAVRVTVEVAFATDREHIVPPSPPPK